MRISSKNFVKILSFHEKSCYFVNGLCWCFELCQHVQLQQLASQVAAKIACVTWPFATCNNFFLETSCTKKLLEHLNTEQNTTKLSKLIIMLLLVDDGFNNNLIITYFERILTWAGIALMKPTSFLLEATLTPQCHCVFQPGGFRALEIDTKFTVK